MITKKVQTEHGELNHDAKVAFLPNGQLVVDFKSQLGDAVHVHRHTVGAEDGKDSVAQKSDTELKAYLQSVLDEQRAHAEKTLTARAKVQKIVGGLF